MEIRNKKINKQIFREKEIPTPWSVTLDCQSRGLTATAEHNTALYPFPNICQTQSRPIQFLYNHNMVLNNLY